jgi:uncharacterized protein
MPELKTAVIDSIRVSLTSTQRIIILRESEGGRYLPIWIGPFETESITIALQEIEVSRPQTHDLIKNIFHALDVRLKRIEINAIREDVFYGKLVLEVDGKNLDVDARPSDAIALAVRYQVPILVEDTIFALAGIAPELDIRSSFGEELENQQQPSAASDRSEKIDPTKLEVFENFLNQLHLDDMDKPSSLKKPDNEHPTDPTKSDKP